jgi:hypothetical protein
MSADRDRELAVVKRDDVLGGVVAAIKRSGNLLLKEILDAAFLHRSKCAANEPGTNAIPTFVRLLLQNSL